MNNLSHAFCVFLLITTIKIGYNQSAIKKIDSLIVVLEYSGIKGDDYERINKVCEQIKVLSIDNNYITGLFTSQIVLASVYKHFPEEKSTQFIKICDSLAESFPDKILINRLFDYYLIKGKFAGNKGDFLQEIENYLIADSLSDFISDSSEKSKVKFYIGSYYDNTSEYEKALYIVKQALQLSNNDHNTLYIINALGSIHNSLQNYDSGLFYTQKAIDLGIGEYTKIDAMSLQLANSYIGLKKYNKAKVVLDKAKKNILAVDSYSFSAILLERRYIKLFQLLEEHDSVIYHSKILLKTSDSTNYTHGIEVGTWSLLVSTLKKQKQYDLLEYLYTHNKIKDSIDKRVSLEIEKKYTTQYETLEKEAKIKELEFEKEIEKKQKIIIYGVLIGVYLLLLFWVLKFRNKQKLIQEKAELIIKQKETELTSKIALIQNNVNIIERLKLEINENKKLNDIVTIFEKNYISDLEWNQIIIQFNIIHPNFLSKIKEMELSITPKEMRLAILLKLNYSNISISEILKISTEGARKARYRLMKKFDNKSIF